VKIDLELLKRAVGKTCWKGHHHLSQLWQCCSTAASSGSWTGLCS
jgi:hypothetical protein